MVQSAERRSVEQRELRAAELESRLVGGIRGPCAFTCAAFARSSAMFRFVRHGFKTQVQPSRFATLEAEREMRLQALARKGVRPGEG